jgi:flavin reductase (DIM6/NTAB) family NADH-FMN oxidoreductase RutF
MEKINIRKAISAIIPEVASIVISKGKDEKPNGMVCAWVTICSFNPPMIAIFLGTQRYTSDLIMSSGRFVVSFVNKNLEEVVKLFGSKSGRDIDKFKKSGVEFEISKDTGIPMLKDATYNFDCKLVKKVKTGDHYMFVGEILAVYKNPDEDKILFHVSKNLDGGTYSEM